MTRKQWWAVLAVATLGVGPGCVACRPQACSHTLDSGPACDLPASARDKVYVFLVNGVSLFGESGLSGLRDQLHLRGFAKVGYGQIVHTGWMGREMKRIYAENPETRFVVVGYDLGGSSAVKLANDCQAAGVPVEGLVLLDPTGKTLSSGFQGRTLLVSSRAGRATVPHTDAVCVSDASHFTLPCHPETVAAVTGLLHEVAVQVFQSGPKQVVDSGWGYEHAPDVPAEPTAQPAETLPWQFLRDRPDRRTPMLPTDEAGSEFRTPFEQLPRPAYPPG